MTLLIQPWWMYINFEFRIQQKFHMTEWLIFIPIFACNSKYFSSEGKFMNSDIMNFALKSISKLFLIYLVPKSLYIGNFLFACEQFTLYLTKIWKIPKTTMAFPRKEFPIHTHPSTQNLNLFMILHITPKRIVLMMGAVHKLR